MKKGLIIATTLAMALGVGVFAGVASHKEASKEAAVVEAAAPSGNIFRFTKPSSDWDDGVYAYAYGGTAESMTWPGESLGYSYNSYDEAVYVYVTSGMPEHIIFHNNRTDNGRGRRAEVEPSSENKCWYTTGENSGWTDNQLKLNTSTWSPSNYTYYFYDYHNQFKSTGVCAYAFSDNHTYENAGWPGVAMTAVSGSSGNLYSISVDSMFDKVIFNNNDNGKQTHVDEDWTNKKSGQCMSCWTNESMDGEWKSDMDDIYANDWVFQFMHFREIPTSNNTDTGACKGASGYYSKAKTAYQSYTAEIKTKISGYTEWDDAQARLAAWAKVNGETATFSGTALTVNAANNFYLSISGSQDSNTMIIVITIAAVSVLAFTTLLVFKKKKQK